MTNSINKKEGDKKTFSDTPKLTEFYINNPLLEIF